MTLHDLSQLYYLNREIENDKQRLEELRANSGAPSSPVITGLPHSPSYSGSKVEREVLAIVTLEQLIENKIKRCQLELIRLQQFIEDIPDSLTRQPYQYRFVNGLDWQQVAEHIGGGNTEEAVKKRCYRYLKQYNKERGIK